MVSIKNVISFFPCSFFPKKRFHYHFNDHALLRLLPSSSLSSDFFSFSVAFLELAGFFVFSCIASSLFLARGDERESMIMQLRIVSLPLPCKVCITYSKPTSHCYTCQCNMYWILNIHTKKRTLPHKSHLFTLQIVIPPPIITIPPNTIQ